MNTMLAQIQFDGSQWLAPFSRDWLPGTACSALVGIACAVLGCFVVLRRMALIGDALAHAVLPGVVIAFMLTGDTGIMGLFLGALLAGLVTAGLIKLVSQFSRTKEDSAIGIVFTSLFALGIILISSLPRGTHFDLKCFLFGDPLAVDREDLIMMACVAPAVIATVAALYHRLKIASFDPLVAAAMGISVTSLHYLLMGLLSATVVAGLKTTGVVLVVAMVITPASAAYQLTNRLAPMLVLAGAFGAVSAILGMSLAFVTNSPTGPAMVIVATLLFLVAMLLSPAHGLLFRGWQRARVRRHTREEDVLKALYNLDETGAAGTADALAGRTSLSPAALNATAAALRRSGLVSPGVSGFALTERGRERAKELVRAHRLWESYLADEAGLSPDFIHDEAERLEHAHELADEVDAALGFPQTDPHGEIIPPADAK